MTAATTQKGAKLYIAVDATLNTALPQNSDLTQTQYEALTWLEVKGVGNFGQTGTEQNTVSYDELAAEVTQKGKGIANAGDPTIECRRIGDDPGQIEMRAAAAVTNMNNYAFKYELANTLGTNGTIRYNRGIVTGPIHPNGGNEDFDLENYNLGLNQEQIVVEAA
jgi:hypothetical protein